MNKKVIGIFICILFIGAFFIRQPVQTIATNFDDTYKCRLLNDEPSYYDWKIMDVRGYWSFNEGMGNLVHDLSDYKNTGDCFMTTWTGGYDDTGYALSFEAEENSHVTVADHDSLDFHNLSDNQGFMIDFWMKNDDTKFVEGYVGLVSKHAAENGYAVNYNNEGKIVFYIISSEQPTCPDIISNMTIDDKEWHHIVAIWTGDTLYLYIDDMEKPDAAIYIGNYTIGNCNKWLDIGNDWPTDNLNPFDGVIDEVKISTVIFEEQDENPIITIDDNIISGSVIKGSHVAIYGRAHPVDYEREISEIYVKVGNNDWEKAKGHEVWEYIFDSNIYPSGNITIYAKCIDIVGNFSIDYRTLIIDNSGEIPRISIKSPVNESRVNESILIRGAYYDNKNAIEIAQIKFKDNKYMKINFMENNEWIYEFDTTDIKDGNVEIFVRCMDTDGYWSPVGSATFRVSNHLPNVRFIQPQKYHFYIFHNILSIDRYTPYVTAIIGDLKTIVEITKEHDVLIDKVNFHFNDESTAHPGGILINTYLIQTYVSNDWNCRNFGICHLTVRVWPDGIGIFVENKIDFLYLNLKR